MQRILLLITMLLLATSTLMAAEQLEYKVKLKGAVTLFAWKNLADASITTRNNQECGKQKCFMTQVWMTSQNYGLLESLAPTRFHYRSYYQVSPARTLLFERRIKKEKDKYQPYGYKHMVAALAEDRVTVDNYSLWSEGEILPSSVVSHLDLKPFGDVVPRARFHTQAKVDKNPLDRWAMVQYARELPLRDGFTGSYAGTNGHEKLTFNLKLIGSEKIMVAGKAWDSWKIRILEKNPMKKKKQPQLFLWLSKDEQRLPLMVEMNHDLGRIRFEMKDVKEN